MTAATEQRRLNREKRREILATNGSGQPMRPSNSSREAATVEQSVRNLWRASPRVAIGGAVVGAVVGIVAAARKKNRDAGNAISGEVAVHLLNKVELLTIRLQVRQASRRVPSEIDVHRVDADTSSRTSPAAGH
jgi:hypothetical protein